MMLRIYALEICLLSLSHKHRNFSGSLREPDDDTTSLRDIISEAHTHSYGQHRARFEVCQNDFVVLNKRNIAAELDMLLCWGERVSVCT